jgi:hypothetical protein
MKSERSNQKKKKCFEWSFKLFEIFWRDRILKLLKKKKVKDNKHISLDYHFFFFKILNIF